MSEELKQTAIPLKAYNLIVTYTSEAILGKNQHLYKMQFLKYLLEKMQEIDFFNLGKLMKLEEENEDIKFILLPVILIPIDELEKAKDILTILVDNEIPFIYATSEEYIIILFKKDLSLDYHQIEVTGGENAEKKENGE